MFVCFLLCIYFIGFVLRTGSYTGRVRYADGSNAFKKHLKAHSAIVNISVACIVGEALNKSALFKFRQCL